MEEEQRPCIIAGRVQLSYSTFLFLSQKRFQLVKYKKGDQVRGTILGAADEIVLDLEDNLLLLQAMLGNRFVTIFLDEVKK